MSHTRTEKNYVGYREKACLHAHTHTQTDNYFSNFFLPKFDESTSRTDEIVHYVMKDIKRLM